jgi:GNAT superfamily N-acetyltransferase
MLAIVQAGFEGYRAFAPPGWVPPDETRAEQADRLHSELADPGSFFWVAEVDGAMAGIVTVVPGRTPSRDGTVPDLHFRHLFVLQEHWGSGVARALHATAVEWMHGVIRLYTPALQGRARRFYEREGWRLYDGPYEEPRLGMGVVEYRLTSRSR